MTIPEAALRVTLLDTWDEYLLNLPGDASVADLKRAVLDRARVRRSPDEYEVKYNGARLDERAGSLAQLGLPPNAPVIVLSRRRRPAR